MRYLNFFWLIVAGLAAWRLTAIVHREEIFKWFRKLFGVEEVAEFTYSYPDTFTGRLLECFDCTSVWISALVVIVWLLFPYVLLPFALSTLAIAIEEIVT